MKLIIGLGNPGKQYENTRHNAGFIILDELKNLWTFPEFQQNKKFIAEISEATKGEEKILLIKPQTYMNLSGQCVRAILDFYKLKEESLIVIHDDLDIDFGKFKISSDSSAGGHNGVQNIIDNIGTQKFKRIRIGIEGAEAKKERLSSGKDFVMQKFNADEMTTIKKIAATLEI